MADSGDVIRRITIQATGDGIDSTTDAVKNLGDAVDSTQSKADGSLWVSMATSIVGVGAAAVGAVVGIRQFIDFVGEQASSLSDLSNHADIAAMSFKEYQEAMYAAMSKGVSADDFTSGMDKIAADIVAAGRGTTDFTKLLEANGLELNKNASQADQMKQAMGDIFTLFQNATPAVRQKLADIVGVSQSWIPLLSQGADQFDQLKQKANDLGIIIDDATKDTAKQFTDEWHTAVAAWELEFKAALAGLLPLLTELAQMAVSLMNGIGNFTSGVSRMFTSDDNMNTKQLQDQMDLVDRVETLVKQSNGSGTGPNGENIGILQGLLGLPEGATIQDMDRLLDKLQDLYDDKSGDRLRVTANNNPNAGTTRLPSTDSDTNALTHAMDNATRNVAQMEAEALVANQGAGAIAAAKAQADLYSAAAKAGVTVTQDLADKFQDLSQDVGDATTALAKAKADASIDFGSQTVFLSPEDLKIAQALKDAFNNDIPAALNSSEAAAMRMNDAMKSIADTARSAASTFATDLVNGLRQGTSLMDSLQKAASNLSTSLTNKAFTDLFSGNFLSAGIEGIGAVVSGLFGGGGESKNSQAQQAALQQQQQEMADGLARQQQFNDQAATAGIDTSTVAGQLAAFDVQANQQRAAEMKAGGEAIVELEKDLAAQRQAIVDKANQAVLKSYQDFLASIKTGSLSDLSPQDQLAYAQSKFSADISGAKSGDQNSISAVTQDAQNLLTIAQSFFASSTGYADVYAQVTAAIQGLINQGSLYTAPSSSDAYAGIADFNAANGDNFRNLYIQNGGGYADGGIITNGLHGVDSVFAHVAGGEFMTKASSVNPSTLSALQYINSTGRAPNNGNNDDVVRVLTQGFNGLASQLSDRIDNVAERVSRVEDATRKVGTQRRVPGSDKRAA